MDRQDRLEELKKLGNIHGHITSSESVFSKWQGRVSALLSHDPIAQRKFEHYCDFILDDHEFGRGLISHETVEATKKIHALIERVIADLEINSQYHPPSLPENFMIPDPVVIPDAAGYGLPKIESTRNADSTTTSPKSEDLTKEEGLLWFWHHSHYTVKWKLFSMVVTAAGFLLWMGWIANEQELLRDIGRAFQKISAPPAKSPDDKTDSKSVQPKP